MSGKGKDPFDQPRLKGHERSASAYDGTTTAGSGMSLPSPGAVSVDSSSFYDSGRIDSGFQSEQYLSGEITSPSYSSQRSQELDSSDSLHSDSKSYSVLDSGVDIGLSGDLSSLNINDKSDCNDLNAPQKYTEGSLISNTRSSSDTIINPLPLPVDIYYEQDEDGDTVIYFCDVFQTPLHFAVLTNQPRIVRRLVCAGASPDILDIHGNTALHLAVELQDCQSAAAILQPIGKTETDAAQLKYAPFRHANNSVSYINRHNYDGLACIHIAVMKRSIELVQLLLWHGADINLREWKSGMTALHLAVQMKDQKMLDFILSQCVDVDMEMPTYAGLTGFQLAAHQQSTLAHYLLEKGADKCPIEDSDEEDDDDVSDEEDVNGSYLHGFAKSNMNGAINESEKYSYICSEASICCFEISQARLKLDLDYKLGSCARNRALFCEECTNTDKILAEAHFASYGLLQK
ncbi:hypothetical protein LSTR_LSTR002236 [Laodelphax striatellus]|uniref:Uncharacterized protein n=1 Tax=Laodelphax striatellus TaxID=195883 RepID=A0A482XFA9_LAOST|nr:hypothetical protein LSTR_LSTR002236 [Laodelphax striatellus]